MAEVRTCIESLVHAGTCCWVGCNAKATLATIDSDFTEHTRCSSHVADALATKQLQWNQMWGPPDER